MDNQQKNDDFLKKTLIFGAIYMSSGFTNVLLMALFTDIKGVFPIFLDIGMPALSLLLTNLLYDTKEFFKDFSSFFKKNTDQDISIPSGRLSYPVSIFIYLFFGLINTYFFSDVIYPNLLVYLIIGTLWGFLLHYLFKNKYVDLLSYD